MAAPCAFCSRTIGTVKAARPTDECCSVRCQADLDRARSLADRVCEFCAGEIPVERRADSRHCCDTCRKSANRARKGEHVTRPISTISDQRAVRFLSTSDRLAAASRLAGDG